MAHFPHARWVFFDVGHTLIDETLPIEQECDAMCVVLARHGIVTTPAAARRALEASYTAFLPRPKLGMMERLGVPPELGAEVDQATRYRHDLERPYPGISELLANLSRRYQIGVIANQSVGTSDRLRKHGW